MRLDWWLPNMLSKTTVTALFLALFLVSFFNVTVPANASSATIHVYEGQLIQTAINAANEGTKIVVHAGTYHESLFVNKPLKILGSALPEHYLIYLLSSIPSTEIFLTGRIFLYF